MAVRADRINVTRGRPLTARVRGWLDRESILGPVFVTPALILLLLLVAYPFVMALYFAMSNAFDSSVNFMQESTGPKISSCAIFMFGCTSPKMCPNGAPEQRCEGNAVVRCEDGLSDYKACPRGTQCAARTNAGEVVASCEGLSGAGRTARCAKPGYAACQGDRATFCTLVGKDLLGRIKKMMGK